MTDNVIYEFWLANISGIGKKTIKSLLQELESAENIFHASEGDLKGLLNEKQLFSWKQSRNLERTELSYRKLIDRGIAFYSICHPDFPFRLKEIPDCPYGIYVLGRLPDQKIPSVAVIGARACSQYGRQVAARFGEELAYHGVNLVSGMAYGIDSIAQYAAVRAGGSVFAVLGCGVDICYPKEHIRLYHSIQEKGGMISEYAPGTKPQPQLFPPRNRLISALADVLLVVEAKQKSGTAITVSMALEQGKEVFAVPGRINECCSDGCNRLIRDGAGMALDTDDILDALEVIGNRYRQNQQVVIERKAVSPEEADILSVLCEREMTVDEIMERLISDESVCNRVGVSVVNLNIILTGLELKGLAEQRGGIYRIRSL